MKKALALVMLLVVIFGVTACGNRDDNELMAEVTTSTGFAEIYSTTKGESTLTKVVDLQNGETATMHIFCKGCGYDETITLEAPFAKAFICECKTDSYNVYDLRDTIEIVTGKVEERK